MYTPLLRGPSSLLHEAVVQLVHQRRVDLEVVRTDPANRVEPGAPRAHVVQRDRETLRLPLAESIGDPVGGVGALGDPAQRRQRIPVPPQGPQANDPALVRRGFLLEVDVLVQAVLVDQEGLLVASLLQAQVGEQEL